MSLEQNESTAVELTNETADIQTPEEISADAAEVLTAIPAGLIQDATEVNTGTETPVIETEIPQVVEPIIAQPIIVEPEVLPTEEPIAIQPVEPAAENLQSELFETPAVEAAAEVQPTETSEVPQPEIAAEVQLAETPADTPVAAPVNVESAAPVAVEGTAEITAAEYEDSRQQNLKKEKINQIYRELVLAKENNATIEVEIKSRIRGGLRVMYDEMPLFLPASHFTLKRTPTEHEMQNAVGMKINVKVHELQEYDEGRKAVIVSRKDILLDDFWNTLKIGDIVEGKVSSIASFGVFLDLGGVEGLIHISRLSQVHVDDPNKFVKKGDILRAVVVDLDKTKNRIALSRKELEESPWKEVEQLFPLGTRHKGIVRRLTDFGAYIELKPGVDGLLRTPEISWTKRIKRPSDVLSPGQEIEIEIIAVSEEKQNLSLSFKNTLPNPWLSMVDRFPVGTEYPGTIVQVMPQGCIISISEDVDGFMPRSKMRHILQGNKIPFHPGEIFNVKVADLIPEEESLILAPAVDEEPQAPSQEVQRQRQPQQQQQQQQQPKDAQKNAAGGGSITLVDMLSETDRKTLFKSVNN